MWKKLEELDRLYDAAIRAERARYNALLDTYKKTSNTLLRKYKQQLAELISEKNKQNTESGNKERLCQTGRTGSGNSSDRLFAVYAGVSGHPGFGE